MDIWIWLAVTGLVCGVFGATFGVGSGVLMIPILVLGFHLPQKTAQATCLAVMLPMTLVALLRYKFNLHVPTDWRTIAVLSLGAVIGAAVGAGIAGWLSGATLRRLFAVILILLAVRLILAPPERSGTAGVTVPGTPGQAAEHTAMPDTRVEPPQG
jgi:hypothetical protein